MAVIPKTVFVVPVFECCRQSILKMAFKPIHPSTNPPTQWLVVLKIVQTHFIRLVYCQGLDKPSFGTLVPRGLDLDRKELRQTHRQPKGITSTKKYTESTTTNLLVAASDTKQP